ncbi:thrombospondin type 3 repeat-containing protein [Spongiibacter marinus]|uniref:thrombospondin type 3 repeat-containing protein n=1 Tax=Spongiibacter marinus TaxID=354246 RepID=UPI0003F80C59|nr:thrombospondin type 3 repeat-containing protein [Spongiibacter marinus]
MSRRNLKLIAATACCAALVACGGGGGSGSGSSSGNALTGSPVKGPMANAEVRAYRFAADESHFQGDVLDTGSTDDRAAISGLVIANSHSGPILLEIRAVSGTVDLASGAAPVISVFRTVLADAAALQSPVYPSPLTTLAYDLAASNADTADYGGNADGTVSEAEFIAGFERASKQVVSTLGFGLDTGTDLNSTAPMLTAQTTDATSQAEAASYRAAIEAVSAIVVNMRNAAVASNSASTVNTDELLAGLVQDLSDGELDGQQAGQAIAAFSDVPDVVAEITVDPSSLLVPGTSTSVADIESILISERSATGVNVDSSALEDGGDANRDPAPANTVPDTDGDGVSDNEDNCPLTANSDQADLDGDEQGNVCDDDRDGDGVANDEDAFADDSSESVDTDGDGIGNNADTDDDGDGVADAEDAFPLDSAESVDTDSDGIGNNADTDDDGDGVADGDDAFPLDSTESVDSDGDGTGDNSDTDRDGDGIENEIDNCPNVANEDQADSDGDNIGDSCDDDTGLPQALWDSFNWDQAVWQ